MSTLSPRSNLYIVGGWGCLMLSSFLFYIGTQQMEYGSAVTYALLLMVARIIGLGGFVAGAISMFNKRWAHGTLLLVGSICLPVISLFVRGKL